MSGTKYTEKDAAKDTGSTPKQVNEAWHQARNDSAGEMGVPENRHGEDGGGDSGK